MIKQPLEGAERIIVLIGISLATFMLTLDYSIANVAIPYIAGDLAVSNDQGTYVITAFAVGNAIGLPLSGWLSERLGALKCYLYAIIGFTFFSWMCGVSPTFQALVLARFFQGLTSGPLIPIGMSFILATHSEEKRNTAIAIWGVIVVAAPILGPILGGLISVNISWPWIFYINVPLGFVSYMIPKIYLSHLAEKGKKISVDILSFFLLALAVSTLQIVLDKGQEWDWMNSSRVKSILTISIISFGYLYCHLKKAKKPLIDLALYKNINFSLSILYITLGYAIYFGSVVLIPLWLQMYMGYNAIWAGLAVAPIGIAPLIGGKFVGPLVEKYGQRIWILSCFLLFSFASFYSAFFNSGVSIKEVWMSRFLLGVALVFFITPIMSLSVLGLPIKKAPMATGLFHFHRAMAGAIGTSFFTTIWARRTAFHHSRLAEVITPLSDTTATMQNKLLNLGFAPDSSFEVINDIITKEAAVKALNECFWLMGFVFIALSFTLLIGRNKNAGKVQAI